MKDNRKGVKQEVDWTSVPTDERFNPYDYITQDNYKNTKRGIAAYQEDLARLQYMAELAQQDYQNEYNSYSNQSDLMRQAGLNPDLLGVSQGHSAGASLPGINPMQNMPTKGQVASNVFQVIGTVAQMATSLATGTMSVLGGNLSNISSALNIANSVSSFFGTGDGAVLGDSFIDSMPLSNRQKQRIKSWYNDSGFSQLKQVGSIGLSNKQLSNNGEYGRMVSSPFHVLQDNNGDGALTIDDWSEVWRPIIDAQTDNLKKQLKVDSDNMDTQLKVNETTRSSSQQELDLRKPLRDVINNMQKKYDEGQSFWGFALTALYAVLSNGSNILSASLGKSNNTTNYYDALINKY